MTIYNTLKAALRGILANKLRASLTTLGIIIGVASVIAMLALGNGARAAVEVNFRHLGADTIRIRVKQKLEDGVFVEAGQKLTFEDGLYMVTELPLVDRAEMRVSSLGKIRHGRSVLDMNIDGSTADVLVSMIAQRNLQPVDLLGEAPLTPEKFMAQGRFFSEAEVISNADLCVLGHKTALDLFGGDNPLDDVVWVNRRRCIVIGVMAELRLVDESQRGQADPNDWLFMPISTAIRHLFEEEPSVSITARVNDEKQMTEAKQQVATYLRQRHAISPNKQGGYDDDFELLTRQDVLGAQQEAARTFSVLLASMAAVSLIVGGIGIMNVMLVSVTERTREIGVRMAVGARSRDIVSQFLLESILISSGGGILGIAAGILSIPLAASLNNGQALLDPTSIIPAFGVSLLVGVIFGLYPAIRAAQLNPIEALRYE